MAIMDLMLKRSADGDGSAQSDSGSNRTGPLEASTLRKTLAAPGSFGMFTPRLKAPMYSGRVRSIRTW